MTKRVADIKNITLLKDYQDGKSSHLELVTVKKWSQKKADLKNTKKCKHCNGIYRKDKLGVHLKNSCDVFKNISNSENTVSPCTQNSTLDASRDHTVQILDSRGASKDLQNEVLKSMHKDELYETAILDPLIMRYGSNFHISRREEKDRNYVARECRDLAILLMELKLIDTNITCLEQCLSPAHFENIVQACLKL